MKNIIICLWFACAVLFLSSCDGRTLVKGIKIYNKNKRHEKFKDILDKSKRNKENSNAPIVRCTFCINGKVVDEYGRWWICNICSGSGFCRIVKCRCNNGKVADEYGRWWICQACSGFGLVPVPSSAP